MSDGALDQKIIARIKKLHNMAESAREVGNLAEAESFMEGVMKTLAAHNLDMDVVKMDLRDIEDPLQKGGLYGTGGHHRFRAITRGPVEWVVDLAMAVASAHYCHSHFNTSGSYIWFYGRKSNRETCQRMFTYLRDMAEREAWAAYEKYVYQYKKENGTQAGTKQYLWNWLEGFSAEVRMRYRAMRERLETENKGMSVVLVKVSDEARTFSDQFLSKPEKEKKWQFQGASHHDHEARSHGASVARKAELNPNIVTTGDVAKQPKRIK